MWVVQLLERWWRVLLDLLAFPRTVSRHMYLG